MAELNLPMRRPAGHGAEMRAGSPSGPALNWEDLLTFVTTLAVFISVAVSIQQARWVPGMPPVIPTTLGGLLIGLFAARIRFHAAIIHPAAIALGALLVLLVVQSYADGISVQDRIADVRFRMSEWFHVVRSGDISNDNLPFVTLVHSATFLTAYLASWSVYRWRNAWLAVIPAGVVLFASVSLQEGEPGAGVVVFFLGAILLVSRTYLQKSQARWRRERVDYPDFVSLNAFQVTLVAAVALIVAAWIAPLGVRHATAGRALSTFADPLDSRTEDLVRLFHNVNSGRGAPLHGFGSTMPIKGDVKLGSAVLYEVTSPRAGLVRATSYDEYTGAGWKSTARLSRRVDGSDLADIPPDAVYKLRSVSILNVTSRSESDVILTAGTPVGTNVDAYVDTPRATEGDIERMRSRGGLGDGDTYNAIGSESTATAAELRAAGTGYPDWVTGRYLQLPDDLPGRVAGEAKRVAGDAATPYDAAAAVEAYIRSFPFNTAVPATPAKRDAVDYFLFDLKAGYFDYQASAMAVMLRTLGVPARIAVGFALDPGEVVETRYTVRKNDAYTWVEVFFPGYGWVNFNPTQDRPAGGAGGIGAGTTGGEAFEMPSLEDLFPLEDEFENPIPGDVSEALNEPPVQASEPPWFLIWGLAVALALAAMAALSLRVAWNWGLSGLDGPVRLWAKAQRLAGWAALSGPRTETPREWSRRVGDAVGEEESAAGLARAFESVRYARPGSAASAPGGEARASYTRLRNTLVKRILRRGRTAPPPKS